MANNKIKLAFEAIADAIRDKTGETGKMTAEEMPAKIGAISTEAATPSTPSTPSESNVFNVTAEDYRASVINAGNPYIETDGSEGIPYRAAIVPSQAFIDAYNSGKILRFTTFLGEEYLEDSYFEQEVMAKNNSGGAYFNHNRDLLMYPDVSQGATDFRLFHDNYFGVDEYYGFCFYSYDSVLPMKLTLTQNAFGEPYIDLFCAEESTYLNFESSGGDGGGDIIK